MENEKVILRHTMYVTIPIQHMKAFSMAYMEVSFIDVLKICNECGGLIVNIKLAYEFGYSIFRLGEKTHYYYSH